MPLGLEEYTLGPRAGKTRKVRCQEGKKINAHLLRKQSFVSVEYLKIEEREGKETDISLI